LKIHWVQLWLWNRSSLPKCRLQGVWLQPIYFQILHFLMDKKKISAALQKKKGCHEKSI
jgi:hypothetical protein